MNQSQSQSYQQSLNPYSPMTSLLDTFLNDGIFVRSGRSQDGSNGTGWRPAVDLSQTSDAYRLDVDLPGLTKEQVDLNVEDRVLKISGERTVSEQEGRSFTRLERRYGSFTRTFELPANANVSDISASFENGVLSITVPKVEEAQPRRITIS